MQTIKMNKIKSDLQKLNRTFQGAFRLIESGDCRQSAEYHLLKLLKFVYNPLGRQGVESLRRGVPSNPPLLVSIRCLMNADIEACKNDPKVTFASLKKLKLCSLGDKSGPTVFSRLVFETSFDEFLNFNEMMKLA